MSDLQRKFLHFYLLCRDETQAARLAGYAFPESYGKICLNKLSHLIPDSTPDSPLDSPLDSPPDSAPDSPPDPAPDPNANLPHASLSDIISFLSSVMLNHPSLGFVSLKERLDAAKALAKILDCTDSSLDNPSPAQDWIAALTADYINEHI